jgi:GNAT superfamily N-acetyltransferase
VLETARPQHLDRIMPLIRAGAAEGSWDPELALPGAKSDDLFRKIHYALEHGALPQIDPRTNRSIMTRIGGWLFLADTMAAPSGFALYKDFTADAFELWLCGIDPRARGRGLGRQMLCELLATPAGRHVQLARCSLSTEGGRRCAHVLKSLEFEPRRTTSREEWLLHRRTPPAVAHVIATMDMSPFDPVEAEAGENASA